MALKPHPSDPNYNKEKQRAKEDRASFNDDPIKRANDPRLKKKD